MVPGTWKKMGLLTVVFYESKGISKRVDVTTKLGVVTTNLRVTTSNFGLPTTKLVFQKNNVLLEAEQDEICRVLLMHSLGQEHHLLQPSQ